MNIGFDRRSTAAEVTEGIDLRGRNILITGVNSGLGHESMRVLAERGAHVIGAARTLAKSREACGQVEGKTTPVACELSDLDSVRECTEQVTAMGHPLDALIYNAGIMAPANLRQKMGLEMQFLTNHLGHFGLVNRLRGQVEKADAGRIVMLSSLAHKGAPRSGIDFDNLSGERGYDPWKFYGQSKLANILCVNALSRRLSSTRATANAVHPGIILTNLSRDVGSGLFARAASLIAAIAARSVAQGAATQCFVATHPGLAGLSGRYFADCREQRPSAHAQDDALAEKLWQVSARLAADWL